MELPTAQNVTKVQIVRRMDSCCWGQGQNIKITIGPSKSYDPNEPTCTEIKDLKRESGLQDYVCNGNVPPGQFVKLSKIGLLVLCEVKVFVIKNMTGGFSTAVEQVCKSFFSSFFFSRYCFSLSASQ